MTDVNCDNNECLSLVEHWIRSERSILSPMNQAHILVRLSVLKGEEGGLERQEADAKAYCERLGIPVAAVHREVQSAYVGKKRPVLEQALAASAGGHLVVWKMDRLTRRGVTGLGEILQQLDRDGTTLHSVTEHIDARTPMGRAVLGVLAGVAEQSSADASLRIRRAFEEIARQGKRHPGGHAAWGWGEGEGALVREAATRSISGESLRSICNDWNERGIKTSAGGLWQSSPLSRLLRSESLIGVRLHHDERYEAEWGPILTLDEFSAVGAALLRNGKGGRGVPTLLGGLLRCGACQGVMRGSSATEKSGRKRYTCDSCGRVSIYRDLCDAAVTSEVERIWAIWEAATPVPQVDHTRALGEARESLAQLSVDYYQTRLISRELFQLNYLDLKDKIAELEEETSTTEVVVAKTIEQKIRASVSSVVIAPGRGERTKVHFRFGWVSQRALNLEVTSQ